MIYEKLLQEEKIDGLTKECKEEWENALIESKIELKLYVKVRIYTAENVISHVADKLINLAKTEEKRDKNIKLVKKQKNM